VNSIYKLIQSSPGINTTQLIKEINVSKRTIERWIKELRKRNIIEFKGAPKTGGYYIIKN
ncbi:MAG: HTH domain-containing protein, partial [Bacteroidales bacterium]|nr:HTH domain-containing protein [Bacteroidales bacterium]